MYGLTDAQTALAVAVPVVLGALFRIPLGILADRYGGRVVFTCLLAFAIVPCASIALVHAYVALLVGGFFLGIAGASFAAGISFTSKWFPPERQGLALGLFGLGTGGQSIAVFFAPRLAKIIAWESVFWIFGLVSLAWAALFWTCGRNAVTGRPAILGQSMWLLACKRLSWVLACCCFVTMGGFLAMGAYLPTLLKEQFNLTLEDAGTRTAGFVVLATVMRPVGGWLADRLGGARLLAVALALVAALALLLVSSDLVLFTIAVLGMAASLGLGTGAIFKLVPEHFPMNVGAVTGLVGAIGGLGGFFPPIMLGVLRQAIGSYTIGFVMLSLVAIGALLLDVSVFLLPGCHGPSPKHSLIG
jgi:NNP family nitrate/nitrite transporter-like MFS transporter